MRLPFRSSSFDAAVAMDMLEHLPDDCAALCEFVRILRPGGLLVATVPAHAKLWSEHDIALMHFRRYQREEFAGKIMQAGLQIERISYFMTMLYPFAAVQRRLNARRQPGDPPKAAMPIFPAPVNSALAALLKTEASFASNNSLPWGTTIFCVAKKPE